MPPSVIAATWSVDEIQNAEVLADLEGWGQAKRMVARLCAEIHNVGVINRYSQHADKNSPPPKYMSESDFLPKRVFRLHVTKAADKKKVAKTIQQQTSSLISSMAGF